MSCRLTIVDPSVWQIVVVMRNLVRRRLRIDSRLRVMLAVLRWADQGHGVKGEDREEQVRRDAVVFLIADRTQAELRFERPDGGLDFGRYSQFLR